MICNIKETVLKIPLRVPYKGPEAAHSAFGSYFAHPSTYPNLPTYVVRFDVPMHDAHAVAVVQGLQELVQIIPDVVVRQCLQRTKDNDVGLSSNQSN